MEKVNRTKHRKIIGSSKASTLLAAFAIFIVLCIAAFLHYYNAYLDRILYAERLNQMQGITTELFSGLENVVETQWRTVEIQRDYLEYTQPKTFESMQAFLKTQAKLGQLDSNGDELIVVDSRGCYYNQNGAQGTLTRMDYILDEPEKINYVFKSMTTNETQMCFFMKLDEPFVMNNGTFDVTISYCGVAINMEKLKPYFDCKAYHGDNSVYVVDEDGAQFFSSNSDLIKGFNTFTVLKSMEYLHGSSFDKAKKSLTEKGYAYSNAILNGQEYYYALYRMDASAWTLLFLVPSDCVATNTVTLVKANIQAIVLFSVIILIVCAVTIFLLLRMKQKQALEVEREINEKLERLNRKLVAANKAKSDFLSNMSHDIRTPMNAIMGIAGLMEYEEDNPEKVHAYVKKLQLSSRHLLGLINDILDMSKIESGEVVLNHEKVSIAEQVGQIDNIIRSQANERGQTFIVRVHEIVHEYVIGDGTRLRQLFINLLSNAVKYTDEGGTISFDLIEEPCDVPGQMRMHSVITDNGCGMTQEFVAHIFEAFTRAENSVTNKIQGTGLGMAISKNIVDLMGGSIQVESEPGKGTCVNVILTHPIDEPIDSGLVVDGVLLLCADTFLTANVTASMKNANVDFMAARTEEEAVSLLKKKKTDIILLGECLYQQGLAELVQHLRQAAQQPVMVLCVDYAQPEQVQERLTQCGIDGLVARPFFRSNLIHAIDRVRTAKAAVQAESASVLTGMRFLCAEDNSLNAEILRALLEMHGASCDIYADGAELVQAFATVQAGEYDAILMDVQMPNMNGLEAARAIRSCENPLGASIPIVAMTANAFAEDVRESFAAGMDAHVSKPIDIAVLEKTMRGFAAAGRIRSRA